MSFYEVYTDDILEKIESQANLMFSPKTIAINLEINFDVFKDNLKNHSHDAYKRFWAGVSTRENLINSEFLESTPDSILTNELKLKEFKRFKGKITLELYG